MTRYILLLILFAPSILMGQKTGINTTSPNMVLHVFRNADTALLQLDNGSALAINSSTGMYFKNGNFFTGAIKTTGTGTNVARLGFYTFAVADQNLLRERLSILDNGNIGINNIDPQAKLDVNGNFRLTDGTQAEGKVLTSDNSGNATWRTTSFSNNVRFGMNMPGTILNGNTSTNRLNISPQFGYNLDPAAITVDDANNTITINRAGLYHIEASVTLLAGLNQYTTRDNGSTTIQLDPYGVLNIAYQGAIGGSSILSQAKMIPINSFGVSWTNSLKGSIERYFPAGTTIHFEVTVVSTSDFPCSSCSLAQQGAGNVFGHLISD